MSMKGHILAALQEQFERWEELLAGLREVQIDAPQFELNWSIKEIMAHLWAWQQISIARMEGSMLDREPEYPQWITNIGEDWEENADRVNALTFENNHEKPWSEVYISIVSSKSPRSRSQSTTRPTLSSTDATQAR